jgi:hypothetical protein
MVATFVSCMGIAIYFALVAAGLIAAFLLSTILRGIRLI